jgi:hypothetical protein
MDTKMSRYFRASIRGPLPTMSVLGARHSAPFMREIAHCSGIASAAAEDFLLPQKKKSDTA